MSDPQDLDRIIEDWPYQPGVLSARLVHCDGDRNVLQMRIEMGVLQMEMTGRPDGERPEGAETYLDYLIQRSFSEGDSLELTEDECFEIDREFLQFYHRRICCLALQEFDMAIHDADHSLALMDFAAKHSPDERWTVSHEQYRPFIIFHRTQAAALAALEASGAEAAVEQCTRGLERLQKFFVEMGAEDHFEKDEIVAQLTKLRESVREEYHIGKTLGEQLAEAVAAEEYERAARLRDRIARRVKRPKTD